MISVMAFLPSLTLRNGWSGPEPGQGQAEVTGLASDALACLAADGRQPEIGQVTLNWSGQPQRARLIVWVAGAEAAHPILVNGQRVAQAPIFPYGEPCRGEPFYLDIPPTAVVQGANTVELTSSGRPGDAWTAAHVRLEVFGVWRAQPALAGPLAVAAPISLTVSISNPYDLSNQEAWIQVPDSYNAGVPTPLVLYVHGRSSEMYEPTFPDTQFDDAANSQGWLLASPQLHGHWPGTALVPIPDPPGKYAYASLESQYDIIGTVDYMLDHYNVKRDQIYLVGSSMGGQTVTVMAAKFPHVFAAVSDVKGPTDFAQWYTESDGFHQSWMERECYAGNVSNPLPRTPAQNPYCYERRSSQSFAGNYLHVPITITHSLSDTLVPISHSFELRDAINSYGPDQTAAVHVDTVVGPTCGEPYHCYIPAWSPILQFLSQFALDNLPLHVHAFTDHSKPIYWLSLTQSAGDHWSQVEATAHLALRMVTLTVTDPQSLTLRLNLGTAPQPVEAGLTQPGLGFPAGLYRVQGAGLDTVVGFTNGYLTLNLPPTDQDIITVSPAAGIVRLFVPLVRR